MFSKILINGKIETVTGLHIGTGGDYSAIGAADSPVIRDAVSGMPMIPGSSLKGKLRSLLGKKYNSLEEIREGVDCAEINGLFGGKGTPKKAQPSRLIFSDMFMSNLDELKGYGIYEPTEIKFENTINRLSSVANPRQIERVIRRSRFEMKIIYNVDEKADIKGDIAMLADGMKLLQFDYLGGNGSRGYGKVKFSGLSAEVVVGDESDLPANTLGECHKLLEEVCQ